LLIRHRLDEHRFQQLAPLENAVRETVEPDAVRQANALQAEITTPQRSDDAAPQLNLVLQMQIRLGNLEILRVNPYRAGDVIDEAVGELLDRQVALGSNEIAYVGRSLSNFCSTSVNLYLLTSSAVRKFSRLSPRLSGLLSASFGDRPRHAPAAFSIPLVTIPGR